MDEQQRSGPAGDMLKSSSEAPEEQERLADRLLRLAQATGAVEPAARATEVPPVAEPAAATRPAGVPAGRAAAVPLTPGAWHKPVALGGALAIAAIVLLLPLVSLDSRIGHFEHLAAAQFGQPVQIGSLRLALLPRPQWRIEDLVVGGARQLRAPHVTLGAELSALFADAPAFKSIELDAPVMTEEALGWLLFGRGGHAAFSVARIGVVGARLDSDRLSLPAFDARVDFGDDGRWRSIHAEDVQRQLGVELHAAGAQAQVRLHAATLAVPFGSKLVLADFKATGSLDRHALTLTEFNGRAHGGTLAGTARLTWSAPWQLEGSIEAAGLGGEELLPSLLESGKFDAKARFAMQADSAGQLFARPGVTGDFTVRKGVLRGLDLVRLLQREGVNGRTAFAELSGSFVHEAGRTQVRRMRLDAGSVSAQGDADMDAAQVLRGRFAAALTYHRVRARANLSVAGTLALPRFKR